MLKASDIRAFFGEVSERRPLYKHTQHKKNIKIKSAKSINLKTANFVICQKCNNDSTSAHDESWSALLRYMHENWEHIKKNGKVKLSKVFPGKSNKQAKNFHLFFVKHFGCRIVDENISIPIEMFSQAVKNNTPHPSLYLTFNARNLDKVERPLFEITEVHAKESNGLLVSATYYYTIGELDVQVTWFKQRPIRNVKKAWHPNCAGNIIKFRHR